VQGIQGISPQATEEFGVTCCFARKTTKLSGKQQGILAFTVQLSHDETGIAFIQFPQKLFRKRFSEAMPSIVLKTSAKQFAEKLLLGYQPKYTRSRAAGSTLTRSPFC
jgi:hypothetical protein